MAIVPEESGEQQPKRCHAKDVCERSKAVHRNGSLRPVCPALKRLLSDWEQRNTLELRLGTTLTERLSGVIEAAHCLTGDSLSCESIAVWAHQENLFARWVDMMAENLPGLAKQLQRDYPLSAVSLKEFSAGLGLVADYYEANRASRGYAYLEPPESAREHWRVFRLWRDEIVEAAEVGGGKQERYAALRLVSTFPVDVAAAVHDIVKELAPIVSELAEPGAGAKKNRQAKPNVKQAVWNALRSHPALAHKPKELEPYVLTELRTLSPGYEPGRYFSDQVRTRLGKIRGETEENGR